MLKALVRLIASRFGATVAVVLLLSFTAFTAALEQYRECGLNIACHLGATSLPK